MNWKWSAKRHKWIEGDKELEAKGYCSDCADLLTAFNHGRCIGCFNTQHHCNFTPKEEPTMSTDTPDPPTTAQILSAAEDCPDAKRALKRLYPKVFDKSVELAQHSTIKRRSPYDLDVNGGISMVWVSGSGNQIVLHHDFNWERSAGGKILTPTRK